MWRRRGALVGVASLVVLSLGWIGVRPAEAIPPLPLVCEGAGRVNVAPVGDGSWTWNLSGTGVCLGDLSGVYQAQMAGSGTSAGLGLCDGIVAANLAIDVNLQVTSQSTGQVRNYSQDWFAPITTYPVATPFLVTTTPGAIGAGSIFTRLFGLLGNCPPEGNPASTFTWVFTT